MMRSQRKGGASGRGGGSKGTRPASKGTRPGSKGSRPGSKGGRPGSRDAADRPRAFGLGAVNVALLVAAAVSIIAGYVLLDRGSITAAPMLLVLGYVVLIPAGLLVGSRRDRG